MWNIINNFFLLISIFDSIFFFKKYLKLKYIFFNLQILSIILFFYILNFLNIFGNLSAKKTFSINDKLIILEEYLKKMSE